MNNEQLLRNAISWAISNVSNYPEDVRARLLGANLSRVIDAVTANVMSTGLVEAEENLIQRPQVNRVEVIDGTGRAYVNMGATDVCTSLQDGGRTLKIFMGGADQDGARNEPVLEYFVEITNTFSSMSKIINDRPFKTLEDAEIYLAAQLRADKALGTTRFTYRILCSALPVYTEVKR